MAEQSLDVKTDEIYGRNNEKGKEMKNYQDAEKQILAIQAAQQQNLRAGKLNNLAQYRNTQNLIGAGNAMSQANAGNQQQTQQVAVNPQTQQILQKYGASKPGTVTKTTHSQQVTKQNITINNNTTNTTNNTVRTVPAQQQVIRPQKDNSNEKFKLWLNNTLARQQEDYARREKDYDKRETALTRDSNKMLRKLGEFSKDIMEKMDPRNIGSTATSQIKSLLFIFGFQYLASNWTKIIKTVGSIEKSIKKGLTYFGLYNMNGQDTGFTFRPGESQLALDLKGLLTGEWGTSPLWYKGEKVSIQGRSSSDGTGGLMGIFSGSNGDGGFINGLKKVLFGNTNNGGNDKGLVEIIKEYFTLQGKKRMDAAKLIEKPTFPLSDPGAGIKAIGEYIGQMIRIFLGDPDEALKDNIASKISLDANYRSIKNAEDYSEAHKSIKVNIRGTGEEVEARQGAYGILHGKHKGVTARMLNSDGELTRGDAESTIAQGSDLLLTLNKGIEDGKLDSGIMATGFDRLYKRAKEEGKVALTKDVAEQFLPKDIIDKLKESGDIKEKEYVWVLRSYKGIDDTFESALTLGDNWGNKESWLSDPDEWKKEHWRLVPVEHPLPTDRVTYQKDPLYELTPKAIETILKYRTNNAEFDIDLKDQRYIDAIDNWSINLMREKSHINDPNRYIAENQNRLFESTGSALNGLNVDQEQVDLWNKHHLYYGDDEEAAKRLNTYNRDEILRKGKNASVTQGMKTLTDVVYDFNSKAGWKGDFGNLDPGYFINALKNMKGQTGTRNANTYNIKGVNKETGEEIVINPSMVDNMTSEQVAKLLKNLDKYDFGSQSIDFKEFNREYDESIFSDLLDILSKYSPADGSSKEVRDNYKNAIKSITAADLSDPKKLKSKITEIINKYTLDMSGLAAGATKDELEMVDHSQAQAKTASQLANNLLDNLARNRETIPAEWDRTVRSAASSILSDIYRVRRNAEERYEDDLNLVEKLKTNTNLRYKLSNDVEYEGGDIRSGYSAYNEYQAKYIDRENAISEDIGNNTVTSAARRFFHKGAELLDDAVTGIGEYSQNAKGWLTALFQENVNKTVNDFIRNLEYPNVSLARYPEGTRIKQKEGLLIWYAFNPYTVGERKENVCDFVVRDASGRFGAGRMSGTGEDWKKPKDRLWDRIHAGQDVSLFYVDDKVNDNSTYLPHLYAPFNGYLDLCSNSIGGSGRQILLRQTKDDGKGRGGRFGIYVCHLSKVSDKALDCFKNNLRVDRGTDLGTMGGSGYVKDKVTKKSYPTENAYGPHFHIQVLDYDHPGPFDGPFDKPLPGVSPNFKGFSVLAPLTCQHAVDPLFVFVDNMTGDMSNETLYLTEDRKVVNIEDFDKTGKGVSSEGNELFKGGEKVESEDVNVDTGERKKEGEGEAKEDEESEEGSLSLWSWASDLFQKLFSGGLSGLWDKTKEYGEKARDTFKDLFGKYRNKSMSFRKSLSNYSGVITPEFVNYQNYLKNPGKIKLGEDGKPLSETEWRNEVFDMTGSDPVSLKLGEIVNNNGKSVTDIGGDTEQTINKYGGNSNTTIVNNTSDGSTINNESTDISTTNTPQTEVSIAEARNSDIFNGKSLMDIWKESGKDPKDYLAELVNIASKQLEATTTGIVASAQGQDATIAAINAGTDATNVSTEAIIKTRSNNNRVIISGNSNIDGSKVG